MKTITVNEIFTDEELRRAVDLYRKAEAGTFARKCSEQIVAPALHRINEATGQENSALFLAYALEYSFSKLR